MHSLNLVHFTNMPESICQPMPLPPGIMPEHRLEIFWTRIGRTKVGLQIAKMRTFRNYYFFICIDLDVKLLCPLDQFKDQTFFLSQVPQLGLRRAMFPLGNLLKCDVKLLATRSGLHQIAKKRESAGICFIGKRNLHDFISEYVDRNPGEFVDVETGQLLGTHEGIHFWTVGQRARIGGAAKKMYILRKQNDGKTITLCSGGNHPGLFTNILYTEKPHWIDANPFGYANIVRCKFRFQHMDRLIGCTMCPTVDGLFIKLDLPLRALTPGQYAVFYANDECLGGARITNPGPSLLYGTEVERSQIGDTYKQHHQIQKINESALFSPEEICEITGGNS